jgi:hypothetical protein
VGDQVPVDMVAASILACAVEVMGQDRFEIYHMGTSKRNPIVWHGTPPLVELGV